MKGFRYKLDTFIWNKLFKIYTKYGTTYRFFNDLKGRNWDDYDENGIPYWEKTGTVDPDYNPWDFEDENGDAFRVIRKDIK